MADAQEYHRRKWQEVPLEHPLTREGIRQFRAEYVRARARVLDWGDEEDYRVLTEKFEYEWHEKILRENRP